MTYIYYAIWIFAGNYVLLNLVLAILLDGFTMGSDSSKDELIDGCEYYKLKDDNIKKFN